jgi:hypothetical protein
MRSHEPIGSGAGWYPAYMGAESTGNLPGGSYNGNGIDQILPSNVGVCPSVPGGNNGVVTCAVIISLESAPTSEFITASDIESATCGVYRGWNNTDVDFVSGNSFAAIDGCLESAVASPSCATCPTQP